MDLFEDAMTLLGLGGMLALLYAMLVLWPAMF